VSTVARGWSNESIEDARRVARELAQKVAGRLATGQDDRKQYLYGDRPLPEPIIREMGDTAVLTRNANRAPWIGPGRMDPSLEDLVYYHDVETKASSTLAVA
jgi:hypothetical protein